MTLAWRHGANQSGVITYNQSQDYVGSGALAIRSFFLRLSYARTLTCTCFYAVATVYRGRINCILTQKG